MAGEIFIMSGEGGGSLNYEVVSGTSAPSSPSENTIWVNTSTAITSHVFSSTKPSSPSAGMVWINTGASSSVAMNVLDDDNALYVYPTAVQQYVSGAWVAKEAKTYQGGAWVDWTTFLYNSGNTYESVTGGWTTAGKAWESSATATKAPTITYNETSMNIYHTASPAGGWAYIKNPIDLTKYSTLRIEGSFDVTRVTNRLSIWTSVSGSYMTSNVAAYLELNNLSNVAEIDISSLSGAHYIGFALYNANTYANITIEKIILEK